MESDRQIIHQYREADEEQRLYLFLARRDLRREFIGVEMEARQGNVRSLSAEAAEKDRPGEDGHAGEDGPPLTGASNRQWGPKALLASLSRRLKQCCPSLLTR